MKITLEFNTDDTHDYYGAKRAMSATDAFMVINDMINYLNDEGDELAREELFRLLQVYDVNMDYLE